MKHKAQQRKFTTFRDFMRHYFPNDSIIIGQSSEEMLDAGTLARTHLDAFRRSLTSAAPRHRLKHRRAATV